MVCGDSCNGIHLSGFQRVFLCLVVSYSWAFNRCGVGLEMGFVCFAPTLLSSHFSPHPPQLSLSLSSPFLTYFESRNCPTVIFFHVHCVIWRVVQSSLGYIISARELENKWILTGFLVVTNPNPHHHHTENTNDMNRCKVVLDGKNLFASKTKGRDTANWWMDLYHVNGMISMTKCL